MLLALMSRVWVFGLVGICALGVYSVTAHSKRTPKVATEPWQWPADLRSGAEGMSHKIDPTPKRILPLDTNGSEVAQVASTKEDLDCLLADKPPLWRWAVFTSVLLQRRNAVQPRLLNCASGYQPGPGFPLNGERYSQVARQAMNRIAELVQQVEQFMLSPGFTGTLAGDGSDADPDSIVRIANRLMDYHSELLGEAERCVQTPVESEVIIFVQDTSALAMCPLVGYDKFIMTMCSRVAEMQELLPYAKGGIVLDEAGLAIEMPDGLLAHIVAHIKRFNP